MRAQRGVTLDRLDECACAVLCVQTSPLCETAGARRAAAVSGLLNNAIYKGKSGPISRE